MTWLQGGGGLLREKNHDPTIKLTSLAMAP
jgi:hypothetical protein